MLPEALQIWAMWPFQIPALCKGKRSAQSAAPDFQKQWGIRAEVEDAPALLLLSHFLSIIYQMD